LPLIPHTDAGSDAIAKLSHLTLIDQSFNTLSEALERSRRQLAPAIVQAAEALFSCLRAGGKVLVCGNGGSAADAQHFAAELVGRFRTPSRAGLPVLALTADTAFLTAWANDVGFEYVFSRQVETFASSGDLLLGISTSGRSRNVIEAFKTARCHRLNCIALLGGDGGELLGLANVAVVVPAFDTQRIQEVQLLVLHLLCELVEEQWQEWGRRGQGDTPLFPTPQSKLIANLEENTKLWKN
jgi:phosphoheptose isomerase